MGQVTSNANKCANEYVSVSQHNGTLFANKTGSMRLFATLARCPLAYLHFNSSQPLLYLVALSKSLKPTCAYVKQILKN